MGLTMKSKKPLYRQIADDVKHKIAGGVWKADDPIPSQVALANLYDTSEITSRRALKELVTEGVVYRIRGKGTYVSGREKSVQPVMLNQVYLVYPRNALALLNHRFFSDLLQGLRETCDDNHVDFRIWQLDQNYELPEGERVGLVALPDLPGKHEIPFGVLRKWKEEQRKLVNISFHHPLLQLSTVLRDNLTGGYAATEHLLALGHRRIGLLLTGKSSMELSHAFAQRFEGYKLALAQYKVPFDPQLVGFVDQSTESQGYVGFQQLMEQPQPPTAVFATSDFKAMGCLQAARVAGLQIPEDLSLIGYDDQAASEFTLPALTTVNQNAINLGHRAAEMLIFGQEQGKKDEISPTLIVRDSTAAAPE